VGLWVKGQLDSPLFIPQLGVKNSELYLPMFGFKNNAGLVLILLFLGVAVYVGSGFTSSVSSYGIGDNGLSALRGNVSGSVNTSFGWVNRSLPLYGFGFLIVVLLLFVVRRNG
jgi:hypothetical protein